MTNSVGLETRLTGHLGLLYGREDYFGPVGVSKGNEVTD